MSKSKKIQEEFIGLIDFAKLYFHLQEHETYSVQPFHLQIEKAIYNFMTKSDKNLIITMPPRFGKSKLAIVIFISWILAYMPECQFIIGTNTIELGRDHINKIKNCIDSSWYKNLFPNGARLRKKKKLFEKEIYSQVATSTHFRTTAGGEVKCKGSEGAITGFGAGKKRDFFGGCIIIDDPIDAADFRNVAEMERVYDWFKSSIRNRANYKGTKIMLIMQRLHPDDLVGRLLKEEREKWEVLKIQAFDEENQTATWPDTWSKEKLLEMRDSPAPLDQYLYWSQFQQEPKIDLEAMIKPSWWQYYTGWPEDIRERFITMDTAYKTKTVNDETVMQLWGVGNNRLYLIEMLHGRFEFPEMLKKTKEFYNHHRSNYRYAPITNVFVEDKASGISLIQTLRNENITAVEWKPLPDEPRDKVGRVLESSKFIARGFVFLPKNTACSKDLVEQCAYFSSKAPHDDIVDAMTMAVFIWKNRTISVNSII